MARGIAAGVMLALWFVTSALAASPQLHHWLHQDSKAPNHECFFTQLNKHSLLADGGNVGIANPPSTAFQLLLKSEPPYFFKHDYRLSPSRAPPTVSSSKLVVG